MRSRSIREGSVGLLILLGLGSLAGIVFWLRGLSFGNQSYTIAVEVPDALGLTMGNPVLYRGAKVGRVRSIKPGVNGILAELEIRPASLLIPRDSLIEVTQSGFIGQVEVSIQPERRLSSATLAALSPFDDNCSGSEILCNGDRIVGDVGANYNALIRSTTELTELLSESGIVNTANSTLKSFTTTADNITRLTRTTSRTLQDVSVAANGFTSLSQDARVQLQQLGTAAGSVSQAANQVGEIGDQFSTTAGDISAAAQQVTGLVADNRGTLVSTLDNLQETSQELKGAVQSLGPIVSRVEKGKLLDNLETLAENGAQASANLKNLTSTMNNPVTVLGLAQTLDSARVTFQNTQKITTDLEQLTGNPEFRQNLIKLINGLSKLVSSSETLNQQLTAIQQLPPQPAPSLNKNEPVPQMPTTLFGRLERAPSEPLPTLSDPISLLQTSPNLPRDLSYEN